MVGAKLHPFYVIEHPGRLLKWGLTYYTYNPSVTLTNKLTAGLWEVQRYQLNLTKFISISTQVKSGTATGW